MVNGESHYFLGQRYRFYVVADAGVAKVVLNKAHIELHAPSRLDAGERERVLQRWYREQLKARVPPLLEKWQSIIGVQVSDWRVRKMKTRWGSCNADAGRIWLNLELAKKPLPCLEYILVHDLVHLHERKHNDRFVTLMDQFMPQWRMLRDELNTAPLAYENWNY